MIQLQCQSTRRSSGFDVCWKLAISTPASAAAGPNKAAEEAESDEGQGGGFGDRRKPQPCEIASYQPTIEIIQEYGNVACDRGLNAKQEFSNFVLASSGSSGCVSKCQYRAAAGVRIGRQRARGEADLRRQQVLVYRESVQRL